jgi:hypothetical protein
MEGDDPAANDNTPYGRLSSASSPARNKAGLSLVCFCEVTRRERRRMRHRGEGRTRARVRVKKEGREAVHADAGLLESDACTDAIGERGGCVV